LSFVCKKIYNTTILGEQEIFEKDLWLCDVIKEVHVMWEKDVS